MRDAKGAELRLYAEMWMFWGVFCVDLLSSGRRMAVQRASIVSAYIARANVYHAHGVKFPS